MLRNKKIIFLLIVFFTTISRAEAERFSLYWENNLESELWYDRVEEMTNWSDEEIPEDKDDEAIFNGSSYTETSILELDTTIGYLTFQSSMKVQILKNGSNHVLFFKATETPEISVQTQKGNFIEPRLALDKDLLITVYPNCSLEIFGSINNGSGAFGITKAGEGDLYLTAANTYTGNTNISGGTLYLNGSLADTAVTVNSFGTLAGIGTIGSTTTTVTNNGTVTFGEDNGHIGSLTINGNFSQGSAGNLLFKLTDPANYDSLVTNGGSVALQGTVTLNFFNNPKFSPSNQLVLVNNKTGTGINDLTSQLKTLNLPSQLQAYLFQETFGDKVLYVKFKEVTGPIDSHHSLSKTVFSLATTPILFIDHHLDRTRQILQTYHYRNSSRNYALSYPKNLTPEFLTAQTSEKLHTIQQEKRYCFPQYIFYVGPIGSLGEMKSTQHQSGFHSWSIGALAGFDFLYHSSAWGLALAWERLDAKVKEHWGKFDVNSLSLNGYGTYSPSRDKNFFIEAIGGMGYQWQSITRDAYLAFTKSSPESFSGNIVLGTGYQIVRDHYTLSPKVDLQYIGYHVDSYKERDGGLQNLSYDDLSEHSLRPILSLSLMRNAFRKNCVQVLPELHIRYQRELLDPDSSIHFTGPTLVGTQSLTLIGGGRDYVFLGGSLQIRQSKHFSFDANYDYEWNCRFQTHYIYLGMNYLF